MANRTIPELTGAGALAGTDVVHIVDGDGNSRKMTLAALKTFINTDPTVVPASEPWLGARVKRTSDLALTNGALTPITWQAEDVDTSSFWTVGAPTRITIPVGVAKVRLTGSVRFSTGTTGIRQIILTKNGAAFAGEGSARDISSESTQDMQVMSAVVDVTAGDYFEMSALVGASSISVAATDRTWFQIEVIERTV